MMAGPVPIEDEPCMRLRLSGFRAAGRQMGFIVHALQSLGEHMDSPKMSGPMQTFEPVGSAQEFDLE